MNSERQDFYEIKKSIKDIVEQQLNILRFNNCKDLTISIPKPDGFTENDLKSIVLNEIGNTHGIIFSQSFSCNSTNSVILFTLKLL